MNKIANKEKELSTKVSVDEVIKTTVISTQLFPDFKSILGTRITLINNEAKYIMKIIK